MYSKKGWGGDTDPFILTTFDKPSTPDDKDVFVSLVVFEFRDEDLIGVWPSPDAPEVVPLQNWDHADSC